MNELNPKNPARSAEADKELESLSHDDKATFEKIMAEIAAATESSRKPSIYFLQTDTPDAFDSSRTGSQEPDESVQHAPEEEKENHNSDLDRMLDKVAPADDSPPPTAFKQDVDRSGGQQTAFERILSEIESKRKADKNDQRPLKRNEFHDATYEEQEPLDEIASATRPESSGKEPAADTPEESRDRTNLTLEQFNDELNHLLHSVTVPPPVSGQAPAAMQAPQPGGLTRRDDYPEISMDHAPPKQAGRNRASAPDHTINAPPRTERGCGTPSSV